jgi:CelD/BcsL family acetyltransferase involved in cellulose biosynthesis
LIDRLRGPGLQLHEREYNRNPGIELPSSFEDYLATLPQTRRTNLRRRLRHLDDGELELREVTLADELGPAVARWHELRVRQWDTLGKPLMREHRSARFRNFFTDLLRELVPAGLALMWEFRQAGELVGSYVNFVDARAFYQYLGGFEPSASGLGIGKIATGLGIRSSIEGGRQYYDFLLGAESYKYWYGATDRESVSLVLGSRRSRSHAAALARRLATRVSV